MEPATKSGDARLRLILSGLLLSLFVLVLVPTGTLHSQGGQDRIVDLKGSYPGCPIKIVSIRTNGQLMPIGKPVAAHADWIRNLSIEVENISTSVITHIGVRLDFARPSYQSTQADAIFDVEHGVNPFASQKNPGRSLDGVKPHGKMSLSMSEADYSFLGRFLSEVGYPPSIERVHIFVNTVGFADGTAWRGEFLIPDSNAPGGWKSKETPTRAINNNSRYARPPFEVYYTRTELGETGDATQSCSSGRKLGNRTSALRQSDCRRDDMSRSAFNLCI